MTIAPGSTIGIIGGGQLGRMLAMAAAQLGYRVHIYAPEESGPAADVSSLWVRGAYDDAEALAAFATGVSIVTYEFENIPVAPIAGLAAKFPIAPSPRALEIGQDRAAEKSFADRLGARTAPWRKVDSYADLEKALPQIGTPSILKSCRFGYDGKGQARLLKGSDAASAWDLIGRQPAILEGFVSFEREFSIVAVRSYNGDFASWNAVENVHTNGILSTSRVPADPILKPYTEEATALVRRIADDLDYVGVLTLEFFAGKDGPVFNEMAPRVHNSGHWTIEGSITSQFENHIRAICGLPLGSTALAAPAVHMDNLIGAQADDWLAILTDPNAHLHLYGKGDARPGRKMGHVTRLT